MTNREIFKHIDDGANYYVGLFGEAVHMEKVDKKFYSYVKPKAGEQGISFIYNVRINDLPAEQMKTVIDEMKSMNMPIWLDLLVPDEVIYIFSGKKPTHEEKELSEDDEVYLAMLSEEKIKYKKNDHKIVKVHTAEEFAIWAQMVNDILAGGHTDIHPVNHFIWCEKMGRNVIFCIMTTLLFLWLPLWIITALILLNLSVLFLKCAEKDLQRLYAKKP